MTFEACFVGDASGLDVTSRWGLLPIALALAVVIIVRIAALVPLVGLGERLLFGAIAFVAATCLTARVLGAFGMLRQEPLFVCLVACALVVLFVRRDLSLRASWRPLGSGETLAALAVAAATIAITSVAAYWLPVWQWDALGYHLPFVDFVLQRGTLTDVPPDMPYLSTYPHAVEMYFAAWRAMLPDDRLVDAAQIPLGMLGAAAIGCIARRFGARADHAVAAGALWLALPAVFLQLPTNYIDVASAAFLLAACAFVVADATGWRLIGAVLALGLFLGSKPNAPIGTAMVFVVLALRVRRAGIARLGTLAVAALAIVALGGGSYVVNIVDHHNPVWPVRVELGPFELPGRLPMQALLDSGAAAPRLHGWVVARVVRSWLTLDAPPVFDMRFGGLGAVFLAALPLAVFEAWKQRAFALGALAVAALASPDPAVPRYVLAFPGLVLALAAARVSRLGTRTRWVALAGAAAAAAFAIVRAYPGLSGEGPPLLSYASLSEHDRLRAVGANGRPTAYYDALERLAPGDYTVFDDSLELPYLAWPPDLSHRAESIDDDEKTADRLVGDAHARLFMVATSSPIARALRSRGGLFTELFTCRSSPCVVFLRN